MDQYRVLIISASPGVPVEEMFFPVDPYEDDEIFNLLKKRTGISRYTVTRAEYEGRAARMFLQEDGLMHNLPYNTRATSAGHAGQRKAYAEARASGETRTPQAQFEARLHQMHSYVGNAFLIQSPVPNATFARVRHSATMESFISALVKREVECQKTHKRFREHDFNRWSAPFYDFGSLLIIGSPDYMGGDLIETLKEHAHGSNMQFQHDSLIIGMGNESAATLCLIEEANTPHPRYGALAEYTGGRWHIADGKDIAQAVSDGQIDLIAEDGKLAANGVACTLLKAWWVNAQVVWTQPSPSTGLAKVNRNRAAVGRRPVEAPRIIHIAEIRKAYEYSGHRPSKGGTHASPCCHKRTLSRKLIEPKTPGARPFKPYWREEGEVWINKNIPKPQPHFKVVQ